MSNFKKAIEDIKAGKLPSADDILEFCTALHSCQVNKDAPELIWMSSSFEDMADVMTLAIRCADREQVELLEAA